MKGLTAKCLHTAALSLLVGCSTYHPDFAPDIVTLKSPANTAQHSGAKSDKLTITFLGNATVALHDGDHSVIVDGFVSRPGLVRTVAGKIASDRKKVAQVLKQAQISRLDAVIVGHSHYDHVLDAPTVALLTGADLAGSESTLNVGRELLPPSRLLKLTPGEAIHRGRFTVTLIESRHGDYDNRILKGMSEGSIAPDFKTPARFHRFKEGGVYSIHITHPLAKTLILTSAGFVKGSLSGYKADFIFLPTALTDKMSKEDRNSYWKETVETTANTPVHIIPVHWDNFFRDLSKPLKPFPNWLSDLKTSAQFMETKTRATPDAKLLWMPAFGRIEIGR
jgi:L-ascorbate metabolism protein UlaG (beta-lactamase superfamily)